MTSPSTDQSLLRQYLLGSATAESREALEARLFSDDRIFSERLSIAEDELVSDYVQRALNDAERQDFEKNFLCTNERRSKLEFLKALHAYAEREASSQPRGETIRARTDRESRWAWLRRPLVSPAWAIAAAAMLLLVIPVSRFVSSPAGPVSGSSVVATSLAGGLTRASDGELARVRLNNDSQIVRLHLASESSPRFTTYHASLFRVDDDVVVAEMRLTPGAETGRQEITLTLPAETLTEGDYYVRLQGVSPGTNPVPLQRYDFRVLRN